MRDIKNVLRTHECEKKRWVGGLSVEKVQKDFVLKSIWYFIIYQNVNLFVYSEKCKETQINKSRYLSAFTRFEFFSVN